MLWLRGLSMTFLSVYITTIVSSSAWVTELLTLRAQPDAPNGYAPARVSCPKTLPSIRLATGLSANEKAWTILRENNTIQPLKDFLGRANINEFNAETYIDSIVSNGGSLPKIGIAISGGGYRALMNGAGALAAFDNRTQHSADKGHVGGILQATTYLSGLSGGSWVVGSLFVQNFTTVESIIQADSGFLSTLWQFDQSIIEGPSSLSIREYYQELRDDVQAKVDAGFNRSITDYWGRALSYQLVNATDGGPAYTFSSIALDTEFMNGRAPMPLIVALERPPGQLQLPKNISVYEFNPWEMGSYDPSPGSFAPLKYVGSNFTNGTILKGGHCIAGVDNAGFVMGTSSSLFNQAFLQLGRASGIPDFLSNALNDTLAEIGEENRDTATWPNPFYKFNPRQNVNTDTHVITLVDGGEDLQNIPFHPLTLSHRKVDVIIAVDGSADTQTRWPNGTSLVATYNRSTEGFEKNQMEFPKVPDQNTFVNLGLNKRPTFFGCDTNESVGPLIVYLPNAPYSYFSNFTTFDLEYSDSERNQIVENGYNVATMANGTVDSDWITCLGCAILSRSLARTGTDTPQSCVDCFMSYCWNGSTNSSKPSTYEPELMVESWARMSVILPAMGMLLAWCIFLLMFLMF